MKTRLFGLIFAGYIVLLAGNFGGENAANFTSSEKLCRLCTYIGDDFVEKYHSLSSTFRKAAY